MFLDALVLDVDSLLEGRFVALELLRNESPLELFWIYRNIEFFFPFFKIDFKLFYLEIGKGEVLLKRSMLPSLESLESSVYLLAN